MSPLAKARIWNALEDVCTQVADLFATLASACEEECERHVEGYRRALGEVEEAVPGSEVRGSDVKN